MKLYESRSPNSRRANLFLAEKGAEQNDFLALTGAFRNISGFFKDHETPVSEWGEQCAARAISNLVIFRSSASRIHLADN